MSNVSSLDRIVDIANWVVIIALALSFVGGGASILYNRKLNRAKDEQLARDLKDKDVQIERARADAETRLQVETTKVKADADASLKLETAKVRADADVKIGKATKQADVKIAEANERTASVSLRLEEEARKRAEAQKALVEKTEEIRLKGLPRTLTAEQRVRLLEILKHSPKGAFNISWVANNPETLRFADQLASVLKEAGWTLKETSGALDSNVPVGLLIRVQNPQTSRAVALQQALNEVGFPADGQIIPQLPEQTVLLFIGVKP